MADENAVPETDVNSQTPEDSSTTGVQGNSAVPPASETTGSANEPDKRVPYERFNEVIEQRNQERKMREMLEARFKELESRQPAAPKPDHVAAMAKRLQEKLGLKEEAARELADVSAEISRAEKGEIEARLRQYEIAEWSRNLRQEYKDYKDLEPVMEKLYSEMSQQEQQLVVASPRGLKGLYRQAKAEIADKAASEAFEAGKSKAYENKDLKKAVSAQPGVAGKAKSKLTGEMIRKMSTEEYKKRLPEINLAIQNGEID